MDKKEIKKAFIDTVPVMTGYLVLGIGFGIILKTKGFGVLWALAMSTVIYAGSMQFVAIDLMTGGASLAVTALTTLMVNARHLFYGISMVDRYKGAGQKKPYMIYALTDETYSLVCGEDSKKADNPSSTGTEGEVEKARRHRYYFTVSLLDQIYWVTGSVCGSLLGSIIPFNTEGIDFALTALFVTVFVEQWLSTDKHGPALAGLGASVLCLVIFGADNFLIPTMILITVVLTLMRKRLESVGESGKEARYE
ncbi:MAG: AzlC family ABC transporter permease [Anaerovoracaceae bacterium]